MNRTILNMAGQRSELSGHGGLCPQITPREAIT